MQNSIFELVDNDLFVNYLMDQPGQFGQGFPRSNSNQNFQGFNQYALID